MGPSARCVHGSFLRAEAGYAERLFTDEVNRDGSSMKVHSEDYQLHQLGEWNEDDGSFTNMRQALVTAAQVLRAVQ